MPDGLPTICAGCARYFPHNGRPSPVYFRVFRWSLGNGAWLESLEDAIAAAVANPAGELRHDTHGQVGRMLAVCTVAGVTLCSTHAGEFSGQLLDNLIKEQRRDRGY